MISSVALQISKNIIVSGATSELAQSLLEEVNNREGYKLLLLSRKKVTRKFTGSNEIEMITAKSFLSQKFRDELEKKVRCFFTKPFSVIHFIGEFWDHHPFCDTDFCQIKSQIESHYLTLCSVAKAVTPTMKNNRGGRLVAFSCNSVLYNYPDMSPFTSSKAALECFVKCYSNEHSEFNITATALALPTINTGGVKKVKKIQEERYIKPNELSCIILDEILTQNQYFTGNVNKMIKYNEDFYHKSYFDRNPRKKMGR